jgi:hypothetical protein
MATTKTQMLTKMKAALTAEELATTMVFWYDKPLKSGQKVQLGKDSLPMPFDGTLVFVDLQPKANWSHPCYYLLYDAKLTTCKRIEAAFPPFYGPEAANYLLLLRYGKTPDNERDFNPF